MSEHPCFLPVPELAAEIQAGDLSPVTVVEAHLEMIERHDDVLNTYVTVAAEEAKEAARMAERAVQSGAELGPLHGVPLAVKDVCDVKGLPTTFGHQEFTDNVRKTTDVAVQRMLDAGAIVLGKTNTPEFARSSKTDNDLIGPTSTPFAPGFNAGGSSGGSAAAVAAGLASIGQGTDGGGSIRIPASFCGVFGIKPSFGRIPWARRPDAFELKRGNSQGLLTRTVAGAALALSVVAGPHPRDPFSIPDDDSDFVDAVDRGVDNYRIGYNPNLDVFPVEDRVSSVVEEALMDLERETEAQVEETELGLDISREELFAAKYERWGPVLKATENEYLRRDFDVELDDDLDEIPDAVDYKLADVVRTELYDTIQALFGKYDLIVTPTLMTAPFDNEIPGPREIDGTSIDPAHGWNLTFPFNLTGHPAASVPAGFTADGLPVGLQVVGRRFDDETVLAASGAIEDIRPWFDSYASHEFATDEKEARP